MSFLQHAALLTGPVEPEVIARASDVDDEGRVLALSDAIDARLLWPSVGKHFTFAHDKVREALRSAWPDKEQRRAHRRIADALGDSDSDDDMLARAYHRWQGGVEDDPARAFVELVAAAEVAQGRSALFQAYQLLERAASCADAASQALDPAFLQQLGDLALRTGQMDAAQNWLHRVLPLTDGVDAARVHRDLGRVALARLDGDRSREHLARGLACLGRPVPGHGALPTLWALLVWVLSGFIRGWIRPARGVEAERQTVAIDLLGYFGAAAYFDIDTRSLVSAVVQGAPVSLRVPDRAEAAVWSAKAAMVLALLGRRRAAESHLDRAEQVARDHDDPVLSATVWAYRSHALHFLGDVLASEAAADASLHTERRWLPNDDYLTLVAGHSWSLLLRGLAADALPILEHAQQKVRGAPSAASEGHTFHCYLGPVLALLGRVDEGRKQLDAFETLLEQRTANRWQRGQLLAHRALLECIDGDPGEPFEETISAFRDLKLSPRRTPLQIKQVWVALAHVRLAQAETGGDRAALQEALTSLRAAANHPTLEAHLRVVEAGDAALSGDIDRCEARLDLAARLARKTDNPWVERLVAQRRASLLAATGRHRAAERWARRARPLDEPRTSSTSTSTLGTTSWRGDVVLQRHVTVLQQVGRAAAAVLDLREQARVALDQVLDVVGAERAVLFLDGPDGPETTTALATGSTLSEADPVSQTVIDRARSLGKPVVITGTSDGEVLHTRSVQASDLRSIAAAPLRMGERTVGVLYIDTSLARGVFTHRTAALLETIAVQLAMAFETSRLAGVEVEVRAERARRALADQLRELSAAMVESLDVEGLVASLRRSLAGQLPLEALSLVVSEEDEWRVLGDPLPPEYLSTRTVGTGEQTGDSRQLSVALVGRRGVIGHLVVRTRTKDPTQRQLLDAFSGQLATALENASLYAAVQRANHSLEQRVVERTRALEREVNERRMAEQAAQVASRAKSAFLANMSHELRTPLNVVAGYTELVRDELQDAGQDELLGDLDRVLSAVSDLTTIVDDVLDVTRIETDQLEWSARQLPAGEVVADTLSSLALPSETVPVTVEDDGATVTCDPFRLRQALEKVVRNGVQFAETRVIVRIRKQGPRCVLEVEDDGPGIPEELREAVFDRFVQANDSSTRTHGGVGLGLSLARSLVERMGGSLGCGDADQRGTVFRLDLPA